MDNGDRQLLIRVDERVQALGERLETTEARILEKLNQGERRMNDHSTRIRALEQWRWFLAGGLVLLGALIRVLVK